MRSLSLLSNQQITIMDALNNLPKPVIIGVAVVLVLIAGFVIFSTVSNVANNNGYGSKEEIIARQQGNAKTGGHTAPVGGPPSAANGGGGGRGGYPSGYGNGPNGR